MDYSTGGNNLYLEGCKGDSVKAGLKPAPKEFLSLMGPGKDLKELIKTQTGTAHRPAIPCPVRAQRRRWVFGRNRTG